MSLGQHYHHQGSFLKSRISSLIFCIVTQNLYFNKIPDYLHMWVWKILICISCFQRPLPVLFVINSKSTFTALRKVTSDLYSILFHNLTITTIFIALKHQYSDNSHIYTSNPNLSPAFYDACNIELPTWYLLMGVHWHLKPNMFRNKLPISFPNTLPSTVLLISTRATQPF